MRLEQTFDVQAPADRVWSALIDVERVASCLPGAEITEASPDGSYRGAFQVKLGPTTAAYRGTLKLVELDEAARRATMQASGTDRRGQGGARATIVSTLHETGGATRVEVETDFSITGRLASFGRGGMIEDISNTLLARFADCLQERLGADAERAAPSTSDGASPAGAPPAGPAGPASSATPAPAGSPGPASPPTPAPPSAEPLDAGSLLGSALWARVRPLLPVLGALVALVVVGARRRS